VDYIALGGVHVNELVYLIKDLVSEKEYDHVVLKLLTSGFRKHGDSDPDRFYRQPLLSIMNSLKSGTTSISIINLLRKDDDNNDLMSSVFKDVAKQYQLNFLDLASDMQANFSAEEIDSCICDVVHTTSKGADYYANSIINWISNNTFTPFNGQLNSIIYFANSQPNRKEEFLFCGRVSEFILILLHLLGKWFVILVRRRILIRCVSLPDRIVLV
jgi:hypothetical protein